MMYMQRNSKYTITNTYKAVSMVTLLFQIKGNFADMKEKR